MLFILIIVVAWTVVFLWSALALAGFHAEKERERERQRSIEQDIDDLIRELKQGGRWNGDL